jgi:hypothetical protein
MANLIWSIIAALGGILVVGVVFYYWTAEDHDRLSEEDARAFFDAHGHWPDEPPPGHD